MNSNLARVTPTTRMSFIILQSQGRNNLICAEVGVYRGFNALDMLRIDRTMYLHLVDAYTNIGRTDVYPGKLFYEGTPSVYVPQADPTEECKQEAFENLRAYHDRITFVYKQSEEAHKDYQDGFFDYIYIDADHDYGSVKNDMNVWWPKVKKGGILAGHDISMTGVKKALFEFMDDNLLTHHGKLEGKGESDWWIFKTF